MQQCYIGLKTVESNSCGPQPLKFSLNDVRANYRLIDPTERQVEPRRMTRCIGS